MAISHAFRLARDFDLNGTAKAFSLMCRHQITSHISYVYSGKLPDPVTGLKLAKVLFRPKNIGLRPHPVSMYEPFLSLRIERK